MDILVNQVLLFVDDLISLSVVADFEQLSALGLSFEVLNALDLGHVSQV